MQPSLMLINKYHLLNTMY